MKEKKYNLINHKKLEIPFVIYADLEAIVEKIHGDSLAVKNNAEGSYTDAYQKHKDCSYAYKVVCCYDDKYSKPLKCIEGKMQFINSWKRC